MRRSRCVFNIYPIGLERRLPTIAVPLLPGDPDVVLNIQAVFNRAYDAGTYAREVDYGDNPAVPPLGPDQARWAAARLKVRR